MPCPRSLCLNLGPTGYKPSRASLLTKSPLIPPSPLFPLTPRPKSPAFPSTFKFFHTDASASASRFPTPLPHPRPPPSTPLPWTWRCHLCNTTYRLGVTRRCLNDRHFFCSVPPAPLLPETPSPVSPPTPTTEPSFTSSLEATTELMEGVEAPEISAHETQKTKHHSKTRKAQRICSSFFDYDGWIEWNSWRRELQVTPAHLKTRGVSATNGGTNLRNNCYQDCDFPSECHWKANPAYIEAAKEIEGRTEGLARGLGLV